MPDESVIELAGIAGVDQVRALGEYRWEWLAKKKVGAVASGAALAFGVAVAGIAAAFVPTAVQAKGTPSSGVHAPHIISIVRRILCRLNRLEHGIGAGG
jgi:hypothetical protein